MHNRMKEPLVLLIRMEKAFVRPPLMKLPVEEIESLRAVIKKIDLSENYKVINAAE